MVMNRREPVADLAGLDPLFVVAPLRVTLPEDLFAEARRRTRTVSSCSRQAGLAR